MAERNDLNGWSLRAAGRYAGLSANAVRTLLRLDPHQLAIAETTAGPLSPVDVLVVRLLSEMGANRSVNKSARDERSRRLADRDLRAVSTLRLALAERRVSRTTRLVVGPQSVDLASRDLDVMTLIDAYSAEPILVLPVGAWLDEIADIEANQRRKAS